MLCEEIQREKGRVSALFALSLQLRYLLHHHGGVRVQITDDKITRIIVPALPKPPCQCDGQNSEGLQDPNRASSAAAEVRLDGTQYLSALEVEELEAWELSENFQDSQDLLAIGPESADERPDEDPTDS